jgi:acetyltransferase-like isoleucine patch superfamily enzyme
MNKDCEIVDSKIAPTAKINDYTTLINANVGENCMTGKLSKMAYSSLDTYSYIGDQTIVINSVIGKFTSISWGVTIGPEDHDYSRVTSHSFLYSVKSFQLADKKHYSPFERPCTIGNDVWIGCNATILRGVTIGDGAVVGANSLVRTSVPPYAIVAGSPARIIKFRFPDEIIRGLVESAWWDLDPAVISENAALFAEQPTLDIIKKIKALRG